MIIFSRQTGTVLLLGSLLLGIPTVGHTQTSGLDVGNQSVARFFRDRAVEVAQVERQRDADTARSVGSAPPPPSEQRTDSHASGEMYVAGFGGYTFGHGIGDPEGFGSIAGVRFNDGIDLKNSGVYGAKVGYFFPDRLDWLGLEVEAFNTTPHIKQHAEFRGPGGGGETISEGSHLRVTTLAFNVVGRLKLACGARSDSTGSRRVSDASRDEAFCPLQPYAGVGLGLFFARANDIDGSNTDNAVPGLNVLAGVRYFVTRHVAVFGEYKYNRATFEFDRIDTNLAGVPGGFRGNYSASMLVGGLSFHF